MANFIPGKEISTFTTKKGNQAVIRYPKWDDIDSLTQHINELSKENIFLNVSGEVFSRDEEVRYLSTLFVSIEFLNKVYLACFVNNQLAGVCSIERSFHHRTRAQHVGILGLTIDKQFRGEGIGYELTKATIEEARKALPNITLVTLNVFSENDIAINLYKKLGFSEYGRLPKGLLHNGRHMDLVEMCKEI